MVIGKIFKEKDPTKGSIIKYTFSATWYLWINTLFWIGIQSWNLYWVSKLGIISIAALTIGNSAFMFLMTIIGGLITATYGLVGSFNREDPVGLDKLIKQILATTWLFSILIFFFGYFLGPSLLKLLGAESEIISLAAAYLKICVIGGIISFSLWPIIAVMRATRDMAWPMIIVASVLALQGIFDYLFILGNFGFPKMGIEGAALSLALSAIIGTIIGFWILVKRKKIDLKKWRDFKIELKTLKEIIKLSGFNTLEGIIRMTVSLSMLRIVALFGTPALAAYGICHNRIFRYLEVFGLDLATTTKIAVSNNLGDKKVKRAEDSAWIISSLAIILMGICGLIIFIFASQIVGIFSQDSEVLKIGVSYFRIMVFGYVFSALGLILAAAFAGARITWIPMIVNFLTLGLIQISLSLYLPNFFNLGISGVWLAMLTGMTLHGLILAILFKAGYWKPRPIRKE